MLNTATGAAAGLLFWLILARVAGLPPVEIGLGAALVALGTIVGVLAKGGLDTALLRSVPGASREEAGRLLRFAALAGAAVSVALTTGIAAAAFGGHAMAQLSPLGWFMVAAIAILLVVTWLQDAYFLAEGDAKFSFQRNLVLSAARVLLPLPIVLLASPYPVAVTWALALLCSALAAVGFARRIPARSGRLVPRRAFLQSAMRNVSGSAAEFLPGLLLAPLVLAIDGAEAAAYFAIAWTAASLLFLASAAMSRSALAEMVRAGPSGQASAIRRAALHHLVIVVPAALVGMAIAGPALGVFGPGYAQAGGPVLVVLCASVLFVAPSYLYLSVLRARDRWAPLLVFPAAMMLALAALAPLLAARFGLVGVAIAWLLANIPFGLYAAWKLWQEHDAAAAARESLRPTHLAPDAPATSAPSEVMLLASPVRRGPYPE